MSTRKIKPGDRFGRLVVTEICAQKYKAGGYYHRCICDCGKETLVRRGNLISGSTKSCGCQQHAKNKIRSIKHGQSYNSIYAVWKNMKKRCFNKNSVDYYLYGGRGITVCDKWLTFKGFYNNMGDRPFPKAQIDRIDVNGNYYKENCRWVTPKENSQNKRNTITLYYMGVTKTMIEWCAELFLNYSTILARFHKGWSVERVLSSANQRNSESRTYD